MASKEEIRLVYSELQGYLAQAPDKAEGSTVDEQHFWDQYNSAVEELNSVTGKDYNRFKIEPTIEQYDDFHTSYVKVTVYRQKLGGLIARLHGEYFSDEPAPFVQMPSTVISQNQSQSLQVQLLEVGYLIQEKLGKAKDGSKQKTFLEKVKASLSSVSNITQLIALLAKLAHDSDISIEQLKDLFS